LRQYSYNFVYWFTIKQKNSGKTTVFQTNHQPNTTSKGKQYLGNRHSLLPYPDTTFPHSSGLTKFLLFRFMLAQTQLSATLYTSSFPWCTYKVQTKVLADFTINFGTVYNQSTVNSSCAPLCRLRTHLRLDWFNTLSFFLCCSTVLTPLRKKVSAWHF